MSNQSRFGSEYQLRNPNLPATAKQLSMLRYKLDDHLEELTDDQIIKIITVMAFGTKRDACVLIGMIIEWEHQQNKAGVAPDKTHQEEESK